MVQKFKSKFDKHIQDNAKRKESLKRKLNERLNYQEVIKNALSNSNAGKSRKIVFDNDIVSDEKNEEKQIENNGTSSVNKTEEKLNLFDESDNDDVNYEIEIKNKYEGKKGNKLLNLQSNYNNDERFKLDERFYDDDDDEDEEECDPGGGSHKENDAEKSENLESNELENEKKQQLKILEDVLGQPIETKQKKSKKSFTEMVRFDASNEDHKRRDVPTENADLAKATKKKKLSKEERKKKKQEEIENESKVNSTSEEKFYRVSDDLRVALKSGKSEKSQFSLLGAFSRDDAGEASQSGPESEKDGSVSADEDEEEEEEGGKEGVKLRKVEEEVKVKESQEEKVEVATAQGIKKERFFFAEDDPRIEEGVNFINMRNSEEAKKALENYDSTRRDIREVLRLRWQKHRQRNNPFKKKVGGSFKKNGQFNGKRKFFGKNPRTR